LPPLTRGPHRPPSTHRTNKQRPPPTWAPSAHLGASDRGEYLRAPCPLPARGVSAPFPGCGGPAPDARPSTGATKGTAWSGGSRTRGRGPARAATSRRRPPCRSAARTSAATAGTATATATATATSAPPPATPRADAHVLGICVRVVNGLLSRCHVCAMFVSTTRKTCCNEYFVQVSSGDLFWNNLLSIVNIFSYESKLHVHTDTISQVLAQNSLWSAKNRCGGRCWWQRWAYVKEVYTILNWCALVSNALSECGM
jgi:hypothetical protein